MAVAVIIGSGAAWTLAFGFHWAIPVVGFAAIAAAFSTTTHYYWQRFGRVRSQGLPETPLQRFPWLWGVFNAAALIADTELQGSGTPSFFLPFLSAAALWRAMSDWPFQVHWALVSAAGLVGSVLFVFLDTNDNQEQWIATSLCFIFVALFIAGWLDHRLVVRALRGGTSTNEGGEVDEAVVR